MESGERLRERLSKKDILVLPGIYDALTAKIAVDAGFDGLVMGGYAVSASRLGQPDVGYLSMTEMAESLRMICSAVDVPVVADGDTGYGNAMSARRTFREYERAGAAAILLEDQVWPKRCGHMAGKQVIPAEEHAKKLRAAADGKLHDSTILIARTDSRAVTALTRPSSGAGSISTAARTRFSSKRRRAWRSWKRSGRVSPARSSWPI